MQLYEQAPAELAAGDNAIGAELYTLFHVSFCLVAGYVATAAWMKLRPSTNNVAKKIDDSDDTPEVQPVTEAEDKNVKAAPGMTRSRRNNAQERKRQRNISSCHSKQDSASCPNTDAPATALRREVECECEVTSAHVAAETSTATNDADRVSKLMAKKAERKAKKAATAAITSAAPAAPAVQEESLPQSVTNEVEVVQVPVIVEAEPEIVADLCEVSDDITCVAENDAASNHSQTTQEPAYAQSVTSDSDGSLPVATAAPSSTQIDEVTEQPEPVDVTSTTTYGLPLNFDDIMSDSDSEGEEEDCANTMLGNMPFTETTNQLSSAPVLWCSAPEGPIDGWMAVAVPAECAPSGAFDGLWKSQADERILIDKLEIMFESGATWCMQMHSATSLSVTVDGEQIYAELDSTGEKLLWSNGDTWTFFGTASEDPSMGETQLAGADTVAGVMMHLFPDMAPEAIPAQEEYSMYHELGMPAQSTWIPRESESDEWEICWDLKKWGSCQRGANCKWYHPQELDVFF